MEILHEGGDQRQTIRSRTLTMWKKNERKSDRVDSVHSSGN